MPGIGVLSKQTGCNIETIRYYERIGLLPCPPRSAGGHRQFTPDIVTRLKFIRRARELGFTLGQVRELLNLADGGANTCTDVRRVTLDHAIEVRHKIDDLAKIERVLRRMASQCSGDAVPACPILDALFQS